MVRLDSSLRICDPEDTLVRAKLCALGLGISRVTDVTEMDRIGLPVFVSVRPDSKSLRVNAGKGLRHIDAEVGAYMEAIEYATAEPPSDLKPAVVNASDFAGMWPSGLNLVDFIPRIGIEVLPSELIPSVTCQSLINKRDYLIPAELVYMPYSVPGYKCVFGSSTNGLASGNSVDEATLHGLFEALERDALTLNKVNRRCAYVSNASLPDTFRELAEVWLKLGVRLTIRAIPNTFSLPCFQAFLHEISSDTVNLSMGTGLHGNNYIALSRAICEAAQSRLSHIHGGRDDIVHFYTKYDNWTDERRILEEERVLHQINDRSSESDFAGPQTWREQDNDVESMLSKMLRLIERRGFPQVFRFEFPNNLAGISVIKVIIPRLEHLEHNVKRMGKRVMTELLYA